MPTMGLGVKMGNKEKIKSERSITGEKKYKK